MDTLGIDVLGGDLAYSPYDRDWGQQMVNQLTETYKGMNYRPPSFAPAYQAIIEQSKKLGTWPADYANWKMLGEQAQALRNQISAANKAAPVPDTKPPGPSVVDALKNKLPDIPWWGWILGAGALVVGGGAVAWKIARR